MSIIDQAFIRAYQDEFQAAPAAARERSSAGTAPTQRSPQASEPAPVGFRVEVGPSEDTAGRVACIDVGSGTTIPAPHAAFGRERNVIRELNQPMGKTARAPLSAFSGSAMGRRETPAPNKPALEVDAVRWPATCEQLLTHHGSRLDAVTQELRGEAAAGRRVVAIGGTGRGEGRTTLLLCLARRLAAANLRVVIVDADFAKPELARQLSISVGRGWEGVLAGQESVWEVMIESLADRFSVLPLASPAIEVATKYSYRIAATLGELSEAYDLVLVDAGPLEVLPATTWWLEGTSGVDSVLIAHHVREGEASRLAAACLRLADARRRQLGIAEMFVP